MICLSYFRLRGKAESSNEKHEAIEPEALMTRDIERTESWDRVEREKDIRQGIDLATTLERIEKNFVITDPRLPDNPIVSEFQKLIFHYVLDSLETKNSCL